MRVRSLVVVSLLLGATTAAQTPARHSATEKPKKDECSITGMVVQLAGSEPLKRATVELESTDDRTRSISTSTDAGGRRK